MYYTVIKHYGHLRTQGKCRKCSQMSGVFKSQCNTWVRLLHVLYDIGIM